MKYRAPCSVSLAGMMYWPGDPFEPTHEQIEHLRSCGVSLEAVEDAPVPEVAAPVDDVPAVLDPAAPVEPDVTSRVAALSSRAKASALAAELGVTINASSLAGMKEELLSAIVARTEP